MLLNKEILIGIYTKKNTTPVVIPSSICVTGSNLIDVDGTYNYCGNQTACNDLDIPDGYGWLKILIAGNRIIIKKTGLSQPYWMLKPTYSNIFYYNDQNSVVPPTSNWYANPSFPSFNPAPTMAHQACP